ncbi:MAG: GDSL-type esterase/lipase family protein [Planctomycetaceae bacterium]
MTKVAPFRMAGIFVPALLGTLAWIGSVASGADPAPASQPQWIWSIPDAATKAPAGSVYFRKGVQIEQLPEQCLVELTADNAFELFVNGRRLGRGDNFTQWYRFDATPLLVPGRNIFSVAATNGGADPAAMAAKIVIRNKGGKEQVIGTDATWKFALKVAGPWNRLEMDDSDWGNASALGAYGSAAPWGGPGKLVEGEKLLVLNKAKARQKGHFQFEENDRVVFLGATFIERLQSTGFLEAMLSTRLAGKKVTFRNLGWSGDTVWGDARAVFGARADGFKRLVKDVAEANPTVIVVGYGENEAYAGPAGEEEFRRGLSDLLDALEPTGARILLVGPRRQEYLGAPLPNPATYNEWLKAYIEIMRQTAIEREHAFVSLYDAAIDPTGKEHLTMNGRHLRPAGDAKLSEAFCRKLGVVYSAPELELSVEPRVLSAQGVDVRAVEANTKGVTIDVRPFHVGGVPGPVTGSYFASGLAGETLMAKERKLGQLQAKFTGLEKGTYKILVDGNSKLEATSERLAQGVDLALEDAQGSELLTRIAEKNELYFHRYRPQNETYLFLFRKHEQGNNAVEIPMFDPLIAEKEKEIAELATPKVHRIEVIRTP